MVFIHRRVRFHRSHAGATIRTSAVDPPSRGPEYTLRIVAMQPRGLRLLTDLVPGSGVRPLVDAVPAVVAGDGLSQAVAVVEVARARRGDGDLSMMGGRVGGARQQAAALLDR